MRFKSPGGNLIWLSPLLALAGFFLAFINVREGSIGFTVLYGTLGLMSLLVWFDLKWVAIPLMLYFSFATVSGIEMLLIKGFTLQLFCRVALIGYTVVELWQWRNRSDG
ncbi:hypothetical protein Mal52_38080 [Symmachiella dynata]|uniref:Uncharacterized protein n=1 Tax=Symmachiella dynata TaxID=2527995 RepID=A0A517ZSD1_9PLAN|nr:hypothetical protein [Symmachiella dynata]QDU45315.1 hypothetical protein Mal52_38080 [Symmachiella dynata]